MKRLSLGMLVLVTCGLLVLIFNFMQLKSVPNSIECLAKIYRSPANVRLPSVQHFQSDEEAAESLLEVYLKKTPCPNSSHIQRDEELEVEFKIISKTPLNYIASAYYHGPSVHNAAGIKVTGKFRHEKPVFCHVWFQDYPHQIIIPGDFDRFLDFEKDYDSTDRSVVNCPLPVSHRVPDAVSISWEECPSQHTTIPVFRPVKTVSNQFSIGACVAYITEDPHIQRLIEWTEMHLHFGISHFTVYDTIGAASLVLTGLELYEKENLLKLVKYKALYSSDAEDIERALIMDCILRNMFRYKHMLIMTNNDVLLPVKLLPGSLESILPRQGSVAIMDIKGIPQGATLDDILPPDSAMKLINMASLFTDLEPRRSTLTGISGFQFPECVAGIDKECTSLLEVITRLRSSDKAASESVVSQLSQRVEDRMQMAKQLNTVLNGDN